MKKFIMIFIILILSSTNSFSLSKKSEREMYDGCYPEALHLGKKEQNNTVLVLLKWYQKIYR